MTAEDSMLGVIQARIRERLAKLNLSAAAASKLATGKPDAIRTIMAGHMPRANTVDLLAKTLEVSPAWLMGRDISQSRHNDAENGSVRSGASYASENAGGRRDLPVLGGATRTKSGFLTIAREPIDYVERPRMLEGIASGYAVFMPSDYMEPRYFVGEVLGVHPGRPVTPRCFVILQMTTEDPQGIRAKVLQYMSGDDEKVRLRQLNPEKEFVLGRAEVAAMHRIVSASEGFI